MDPNCPESELIYKDVPSGSQLGHVKNIRELEVLSKGALKSELALRNLSDQGSKVQMVLRLADSMDLLRRKISKNVTMSDDFPTNELKEKWRNMYVEREYKDLNYKYEETTSEEANDRFDDISPFPDAVEKLPPNPKFVKEKTFVDGLFRKDFKIEPKNETGIDVHIVSSKKALRSWTNSLKKAMLTEEKSDSFWGGSARTVREFETHAVILLSKFSAEKKEEMRKYASEFAYISDCVVSIPDVFSNEGNLEENRTNGGKEARLEMKGPTDLVDMSVEEVLNRLKVAINFLKKEYKPVSIGLVGFDFGGALVLDAINRRDFEDVVDAAVVYSPITEHFESKGSAPVLTILSGRESETAAAIFKHKFASNALIQDYMIRLFPSDGGELDFDVEGLHSENGKKAFQFATAWMEIYLQKVNRVCGMPAKTMFEP